MSATKVYIGDTITVSAEFFDTNDDPKSADAGVTFTAYYNDTLDVVATDDASLVSTGVYEYDWEVPDESTTYVIEMKGDFDGNPQLKRVKVRAVFRP